MCEHFFKGAGGGGGAVFDSPSVNACIIKNKNKNRSDMNLGSSRYFRTSKLCVCAYMHA